MGNCAAGNPGCPSTSNLGQNGNVAQCTSSFDCTSAGKVCVQYTATPSDLITSNCGAQQTNPVAGCAVHTNDPTSPDHIWVYSTVCSGDSITGCCNAICTKIDGSKCFAAGGVPAQVCAGSIGGNFSEVEPTFGAQMFAPIVTCQWDVTNFSTLAAVQEFQKTFGVGSCPYDTSYPTPCPTGPDNPRGTSKVFDEIIMPYFCSLQDTNPTTGPGVCPVASNAGAWVGNKCSRFVSNSTEGQFCRTWLAGIGNDPITVNAINTAQSNYCESVIEESRTNPSLIGGEINECLCLNRGKGGTTGLLDETIAAITNAGVATAQQITGTVAGCWYAPCNGGAINQVIPEPTPLTSPVYYPSNCPNICQIIINNQGKIVGGITNKIDCQGNTGSGTPISTVPVGSGSGSGGGTPSPGQPPGSGNHDAPSQTFWEKYKWWIIGISIALIIIIVMIFFGVVEMRKRHESQ